MAIQGTKIIPAEVIPEEVATTFYIRSVEINFDRREAAFVIVWGNGNGSGFVPLQRPGGFESKIIVGEKFDAVVSLLQTCTFEGRSAYDLLVESITGA